LSGRRDSNSRH